MTIAGLKKLKTRMNHNHPIFDKIRNGTVTETDFNKLISEAMPESVRDRVRRKTNRNPTSSHISQAGHQKLKLPSFAKRVQPKRKKNPKSQMNGSGKAAHDKSTRTQRRHARTQSESAFFRLSTNPVMCLGKLKNMLDEAGNLSYTHYVIDDENMTITIAEGARLNDKIRTLLDHYAIPTMNENDGEKLSRRKFLGGLALAGAAGAAALGTANQKPQVDSQTIGPNGVFREIREENGVTYYIYMHSASQFAPEQHPRMKRRIRHDDHERFLELVKKDFMEATGCKLPDVNITSTITNDVHIARLSEKPVGGRILRQFKAD
jgi:hypothetical protein